MDTIPLIDLSPIAAGTSEEVDLESLNKVAQELGRAMTGIGMCNLINHGVDLEKIKRAYELSKMFFELPKDKKSKYKKTSPQISFHGYAGPGDELLNRKTNDYGDLRESWDVSGPSGNDPKMYPNEYIADFKDGFDAARIEFGNAAKKILRCIEIYLKLENGFLTSKHKNLGDRSIKTHTHLRSMYYYTLNENDKIPDNVVRCGEHSDWGTITLLSQDMVGGLEVNTSDGKWIPATPVKDAILLNSGQLLEYWTGGRFHAALHRVRILKERKITNEPRQSLIYFANPDGDVDVFPVIAVIPEKKKLFESYNNEPLNGYNHFQSRVNAAY